MKLVPSLILTVLSTKPGLLYFSLFSFKMFKVFGAAELTTTESRATSIGYLNGELMIILAYCCGNLVYKLDCFLFMTRLRLAGLELFACF